MLVAYCKAINPPHHSCLPSTRYVLGSNTLIEDEKGGAYGYYKELL